MLLRPQRRRAATLVEAAIILPVFLLIIIGIFDLGMGVLRSHTLSQAARQAARLAMVRGSMASELGKWGPTTFGPTAASDGSAITTAVSPYLAGIDPSTVNVKVEWPDGSNELESRVKVTLTHSYTPITTYVITGPIALRATSTMRITH